MKKTLIRNPIFKAVAILLLSVPFVSCQTNEVDPAGSANLKVVNAAPNSVTQSFYLVNKTIVGGGLDFSEATDYINTVSGNRLAAQFRNEGSTSASAESELYMVNGRSYTVYLRGDGANVWVRQYEDDLSAPAGNMAKIKFLHFAGGAPSDLIIRNGSGENLVNTLSRDVQSSYITVAAGMLSLQVYGLALRNKVADFSVADLEGGKIYTIYLTGASSTLSVHKVLHN